MEKSRKSSFFIKNAIMKGMKYHDYIWDLGGTLLDSMKLQQLPLLKHWHCMASHRTMTVSIQASRFLRLILQLDIRPQQKIFRKYKENEARELEHPILFDGVSDLLQDISNQRWPSFFGISSNDQVLKF